MFGKEFETTPNLFVWGNEGFYEGEECKFAQALPKSHACWLAASTRSVLTAGVLSTHLNVSMALLVPWIGLMERDGQLE